VEPRRAGAGEGWAPPFREGLTEAHLREAWSAKARAAALAARRRHLKQHGGYQAKHFGQMPTWNHVIQHARAAHHEGDTATVNKAKRYMDTFQGAPEYLPNASERSQMARLHADAQKAAKPKPKAGAKAKVAKPRRPPASVDAKARVNDSQMAQDAAAEVQDKYAASRVHRNLSGGTSTLKLENARREIAKMSDRDLHLARAYAEQRAGRRGGNPIWDAVHSHATIALDDKDRKQRRGSGYHRGQRLAGHLNTLGGLRGGGSHEDALRGLSKEQLADLKTYHDASGYAHSSAEVAKAMKGRGKRAAPSRGAPDPSEYIKLADHPTLRVSLQRGKVVHVKGHAGPQEILRQSGTDLYVRPFDAHRRATIRTSYEDRADYQSGEKVKASDVTHVRGRLRTRRASRRRYRY
jgi:hypothetical protein